MRVSLITVNYNETATTCALLDSIRRQAYRDLEVIVVDNASRENPAALFAAQYPEVHFIRSEQNLGFAGGNNLALPKATGDFLFFVNNDAELEPGCIETLLQLFEDQPDIGIASPLICYFPDHLPEKSGLNEPALIQYAGMTQVSPFTGRNRTIGAKEPDHGQFSSPRPTAYAHGAAMMIPRSVLAQVGPMWEGFFLYYEELDWCERIRRKGYEIWVTPKARVWHKESLTIEKMGTTKTYYLNHNRILFMQRNFGGWRLGVFYLYLWCIAVPKNCLIYLFSAEFSNLKAYLKGVFKAVTGSAVV